jgi:hypothetical protein
MAIISSTMVVGQKPPKTVLREARKVYKRAQKHPPTYTPDCPALSPQAIREFAELARARDCRRRAERIAKVANFFCRIFHAQPLAVSPLPSC